MAFFKSIEATMVLMLLGCLAFTWFTFKLSASIWREKTDRIPVCLLLVLGLGLRVAWINFTRPEPISDFKAFWDLGFNFYSGNTSFEFLTRHPGPPVLIAFAISLLGPAIQSVWIMNLLFAAISILAIFGITHRMLGRIPAYGAALITAVMPQLITYSALAAAETFAIPFSLVWLWAALHEWDTGSSFRPLNWIALGFLLYANMMLRSTTILYLMCVPVVVLLFDRDRWQYHLKAYATMALTTCLLLSSWVYHQYLVTGGGMKLFRGTELALACAVQYDKNGNYLEGAYMPPTQYSFYPKVARYYENATTPAQIAKAIEMTGVEAWKIVLKDPLSYTLNGFTRMKTVLNSAHTGVNWSAEGSRHLSEGSKLTRRLGTVSTVFWQIMLYACPLGLFLYRRQASRAYRRALSFIIAYLLGWYLLYHMLGLTSERYNVQIMPFVIILFTAGLTALAERVIPDGRHQDKLSEPA